LDVAHEAPLVFFCFVLCDLAVNLRAVRQKESGQLRDYFLTLLTLGKSGIIVITIVQCAMVHIGRFLGEDKIMSTTAFELKGPNKALFRLVTITGSALLCGSLAYMALTVAPKLERIIEIEPPGIDMVDPPKPIVILPPPPVTPPEVKQTPDLRVAEPTSTPPPLTVRNPATTTRNPLPPSGMRAGNPPQAPATSDGTGIGTLSIVPPEDVWIAPVEAPPIAQPTPIPAPLPVAKLVINPVKLSGANPVFPNRPLDAGISGEVTLSFTVTPNGRVENITILSETPRRYGFARAAEEAIATWVFQPQTIDSIPVAYPARYTISFKLED
jgi:periplasmic protein TonB